jgi:uncharacterized OsmC-like protein
MAQSMTDARGFKIYMDEPADLGGIDKAPSPLDFILAAHGGCLNYMTFFIAKELEIDVRSTDISVSASLDPGKFAGTNRDVRAGYQAFNVTIKVDSDASPEALAKLASEVEARCPVSNNIGEATPINISFEAG